MRIPKVLHSYDSKGEFQECILCNKNLIDENHQYIIEKAIRRYPELNSEEVIYEYAMCLECAMEQKKSLSIESQEAIGNYMEQFGNIFNKDDELSNSCALHGDSVESMNEYMVQGICMGSQLMPGTSPVWIGEKAIQEMSSLISKKTRDEMDGFIDSHFGGPPEWRELLKRRVVIV